jgi:hypothetical protein
MQPTPLRAPKIVAFLKADSSPKVFLIYYCGAADGHTVGLLSRNLVLWCSGSCNTITLCLLTRKLLARAFPRHTIAWCRSCAKCLLPCPSCINLIAPCLTRMLNLIAHAHCASGTSLHALLVCEASSCMPTAHQPPCVMLCWCAKPRRACPSQAGVIAPGPRACGTTA